MAGEAVVGLFFVALAPVSNVFLLIGTILGRAAGVSAGARRGGVRGVGAARGRAAPGSYKTVMRAALSGPLAGEELVRSVREAERALGFSKGLPESRNAPFPYQEAGTLYRHLGDSVTSGKAVAVLSARGAAFWYAKSLKALQRRERIEVAQDEVARRENAARGLKAETSGRGVTLRELGRTYLTVGDVGAAIAAFERGRRVDAAPELLEELAAAYRSRGEARKAAQALVEALSLDSSRGQLMAALVE